MARPSKYNPEIAERICELIAQGKSLRQIAEMDGLPCTSSITKWLGQHEGFAAQYARACERRAEGYAEEIVALSDREDLDPNDKRVRIDARKWVACKLLPRKYGESMTLKGDKDNPLRVAPVDLTENDLLAIAAGAERTLDG